MSKFALLFGMVAFMLGNAYATDTIPASDNLIEYTGRIDFSNPEVPTFSYSGVSIRACFTGTSIGIIMNDNVGKNYYNIILDGKLLDTLRVTTGKKLYQLAANLENTTHEIELFKRTEQEFGKTQFYGFVVDEGKGIVPIVNTKPKLIEFIGNSITCGYGNEGVNGGTFGPTTENHYMTYAAITSRNFNARHLAVCKSGIGIYRNYDGPAAGNTDCMTNYYTRTFLYDENPKYSFTDKPDLVCINLGTNDFSTIGGDSAKYVSNYFRLIDTIQSKYTMPDIVCLVGPMMSGATLTKVKKYVQFIADSATKKGKGKVYFFEMSAQTGDLGIGIDYHPTVAQHQRNAQELTDFIKTLKGWKVTPLLANAEVNQASRIELEFNVPVMDNVNAFSGFEVYKNGQPVSISSVSASLTDEKIVYIEMQQPFAIGDKIQISYTPGTIESDDTVSLGEINMLNVLNKLTETKLTKASSSTDGSAIDLTFNKSIMPSSTIEGLSVIDSRGPIGIESFQVVAKQIKIFVEEKLIKNDSVFVGYNGTGIIGDDDIVLSSYSRFPVKNNSSIATTIDNSKLNNRVAIYPNPGSTGRFNYKLENAVLPGIGRLDVYAADGSLVLNQKLTSTEGYVDFPKDTAKGVYIFLFTLDNSVFSNPVIFE